MPSCNHAIMQSCHATMQPCHPCHHAIMPSCHHAMPFVRQARGNCESVCVNEQVRFVREFPLCMRLRAWFASVRACGLCTRSGCVPRAVLRAMHWSGLVWSSRACHQPSRLSSSLTPATSLHTCHQPSRMSPTFTPATSLHACHTRTNTSTSTWNGSPYMPMPRFMLLALAAMALSTSMFTLSPMDR